MIHAKFRQKILIATKIIAYQTALMKKLSQSITYWYKWKFDNLKIFLHSSLQFVLKFHETYKISTNIPTFNN